ncbi:MAG: PIN domain-containing protein [Bacteroidales bacterium]|nr:PIN domain-containing protein [Bacteroidales bacterium]
MKVLIDTNVLLDFYCERQDSYQDAANIFDLACKGKIEIWVSPISFVNLFYITRKTYTVEQRYEILRGLMQICNIASTDKFVLSEALSNVVSDFENMVQYHSARLVSADCIVTRNVKDFTTSTAVKVMTPSQFLDVQ